MKLRLTGVCVLLVLSVANPVAGAIVCSALLAVQVALIGLRPLIMRLRVPAFRYREGFSTPVFSVHLATHSEPPDLVIRTLSALLDQDWPWDDFEVVVMDNNTADPALWMPIRTFCAGHRDRITYLHRTGVQGAKAGALNIALDHTRPDADHIVVVDADYRVSRDFLSQAAAALERTGADYVQFPQSYVGAAGIAAGVDAELEEYFRSNASVADGAEAVLLTGTLCVISRPALIAVGGWSGVTTTEDAELGVRLCSAGYAGRFIDRVVGQGLLPLSLSDLEKQRHRWCSGNFQTFLHHFRMITIRKGPLSLHQRLVVVSQLTAWFNLALMPTVLLVAALAFGREYSTVALLAACSIILSFLDIVFRVLGRGLGDNHGLRIVLHALACRLALAPRSAAATCDAMLGRRLGFVVTDKTGAAPRPVLGGFACHLVLFAVSAVILFAAQPAQPLIVVALLILMTPFPAALVTDASLRAYRQAIPHFSHEVPA